MGVGHLSASSDTANPCVTSSLPAPSPAPVCPGGEGEAGAVALSVQWPCSDSSVTSVPAQGRGDAAEDQLCLLCG